MVPARTAHPRACGDHPDGRESEGELSGSSPRVRGPRAGPGHLVDDLRLIPARAGTTGARPRHHPPDPAHPRACGDHEGATATGVAGAGSSPRVRGPRHPVLRGGGDERLIPARAGTTSPTCGWAAPQPAHPRACGDHEGASGEGAGDGGSSPRVRGPPPRTRRGPGRGRLIPARAGTTCPSTGRWPVATAHPRACGDHLAAPYLGAASAGSSPRVRGRLIPARAGTTPRPMRP